MTKKVTILVVVVVFAVWVVERWDVWFGEHPEPEFVLEESVVGVQLTVGRDAMNERIVSWRSRGDSALLEDGAVRLIWVSEGDTIYPKVNKRWIESGGGEAIYYWSEVKVEEGEYRYAIEVVERGDLIDSIDLIDYMDFVNLIGSIDRVRYITPYYSTKVDYSDTLSVVVLGDVQDKRYNADTDSAVMRLRDEYDADFVLQLGDLIDRPHQAKWDLYFRSFEALRTEVPMIAIVGNHDYHKGLNKYPDERFFYTFPYFLDEEGNAPEVGCCELDFGKAVIYILDSNQPIWRQFRQRKWLKKCLQVADNGQQILTPSIAGIAFGDFLPKQGENVSVNGKVEARRKILVLHHPLRSARSVFNNLIVRWMYESLVLEYGVDLVLAGHEHTYHVLSAEETGGYEQVITNFSFKSYDNAEGDEGRKVVELKMSN